MVKRCQIVIALGLCIAHALFELLQTVTQGRRAHGAKFAQLLSGDRGLELGERLADLFQGRWFLRGGRDGRGLD